MKTMIVFGLFVAALLVTSAVQAQQGNLGGKWVADGLMDTQAGAAGGFGGAGSGGAASSGALAGQRGSFPGLSGPGLFPRMAPRVAELDLTVDLVKQAVSGAINLPGQGKTGCGKLKIADGRTNGRSLSFTTYRTINGSSIPTRWTGEIIGGALSLQTMDTLPCSTNVRTGLSSTAPGFLSETSSLVYRRGDKPTRKAEQPMSAAGRWWTTDNGRVTAVSLVVGRKDRITGSVNVCGDSESRIENGSITGRNISFETFSRTSAFKVRQRWSGNIISDNTLTLSSQVAVECAYPPTLGVVFQRGR
jgi:hypothetical protein